MKNRHSAILVVFTCMFLSFTLGFLTGRTTASGDTIVSREAFAAEATAPKDLFSIDPTAVTTVPATEPKAIPSSEPGTGAPTVCETVPASAPPAQEDSGLININTATLAQLDTLPGIGPVIAQRIIDYREAHGPFTAVSQLTQVEGIGAKRLAAIIDLITTEQENLP